MSAIPVRADLRAVELAARAQVSADVEAAQSVPLEWGQPVMWSEVSHTGRTDGFSDLHRVAVVDRIPKTFCDELVPEPVRRVVLTDRLMYVTRPCPYCSQAFAAAVLRRSA